MKKIIYKLVWKSGFLNKLNRNKLTILTYHKILDRLEKNDGMEILTREFERQMRYISRNYEVISFKDLLTGNIKNNSIIITFDDGYKNFKENAYPILKKYNVKSTLFVISGFVGKEGYLDWKELKELESVDVGAHTVSHPRLSRVPLNVVKKELIDSKKEIEKKLRIKVDVLAYPHGLRNDLNRNVVNLAKENYVLATSNMFGLNDRKSNRHCLRRVNVFWNDFDIFRVKIKGIGR